MGILRWGYHLAFWQKPPVIREPKSFPDRAKEDILSQEVAKMLGKGALERVLDTSSPGFYSRLFVVPKPGGRWRPVIDLKALNWYIKCPKFKMESVLSIWGALLPGRFTISLDLQDAYFHVPIHPSSRKYLRFCHKGQVFQFKALPFGLCTAPWVFTRVMSALKEHVHGRGHQLHLYLDDWLAQVINYQIGLREATYLTGVCAQLGLLVNWEKSELVPQQRFDFIGAHFQLDLARVYPTQENRLKVLDKLMIFLRLSSATARAWQSLLGKLAAQFRYVEFGRLHLRPLQWHLLDRWDQVQDSPYTSIPVTGEVTACLNWWVARFSHPQGVPLVEPPASVHIFTDASVKGWGAHVADVTYQGLWSQEESLEMINLLELRAIRLALLQHNPPLGSVILVATDNNTAKAYVNKQGGTKSRPMMRETQVLFALVMERQWTIRARHIAGKLNVLADKLSRSDQCIPTEWSLHQSVADMVFAQWWRPMLDLCATAENTKCPTFVSPYPHPQALAVDALSMKFEGLEAYVYPPSQLLSRILQKFALANHCRLIVIAPWWPAMSWFPLLLEWAICPPIRLPVSRKMLKQPRSNVFHQNPQILDLHAWRLEKSA